MNTKSEKLRAKKRWLIGAIALLVGVSLGTYVRRRVATAAQNKLEETCREARLQADLPPIIFHDRSGKEIAFVKGTGYQFSAEAGRLVTQDSLGDDCERVYVLYDLLGNTVMQFPIEASVREFDADGEMIFASLPLSQPKPKSVAYDIDGNQVVVFEGGFEGTYEKFDNHTYTRRVFTKRLDLPSDRQIQMYDFSGGNAVSLKGSNVSVFSTLNPPYDMPIVTNSSDRSYIYDLWGDEIFQAEGTLINVFKNTRREAQLLAFRVSTSSVVNDDEIHLYTPLGEKVASLEGTFANAVEIEGKQYISTTEQPSAITNLYNFSGNKVDPDSLETESQRLSPQQIARLKGRFLESTVDGQIITYTDEKTIIHDATGRPIATLEGTSPKLTGTNRQLVTYSNKQKKSFLYGLESKDKLATLNGKLSTVSQDNYWLLTTDTTKDTSYLYDIEGELESEHVGSVPEDVHLRLQPGFTADNGYLLTVTQQNAVHIWPLY